MVLKGRADARAYYHKYRAGEAWTEISSFVNPVLGLIPAITISKHHPKVKNLGCPNPELYNSNSDYRESYNKKAAQMKKHKVWVGYVIGVLADIVVVTAIVGAAG